MIDEYKTCYIFSNFYSLTKYKDPAFDSIPHSALSITVYIVYDDPYNTPRKTKLLSINRKEECMIKLTVKILRIGTPESAAASTLNNRIIQLAKYTKSLVAYAKTTTSQPKRVVM